MSFQTGFAATEMGFFITLEGIDGTGKSTQARLLADRLHAEGRDVVLTREPGGAPGAEEIRALLLSGDPARWSPETEILLFTAARRDHVERTLRPALDQGAIVICDRYVDSTRAYQGSAGLRELVDRLHETTIGLDPDLTLILDLDADIAASRAEARATPGEDRFERKGKQAALRAAFLDLAAAEPGRCHVINADQSPENLAADIWRITALHLEPA